MRKRTLACLLAMTVTAALFTGCGNGTQSGNTNKDAGQTTGTETTDGSESAADGTANTADGNGNTTDSNNTDGSAADSDATDGNDSGTDGNTTDGNGNGTASDSDNTAGDDSDTSANSTDKNSTAAKANSENSTAGASASPEDLNTYASILDVFYYKLEQQVTYEEFYITTPFNSMATYAYSVDGYDKSGALDYTGFGFMDLNDDGVNELLIGNISDDKNLDKMIYTICTIHNNVPHSTVTSSDYQRFYLCEDNTIGFDEPDTYSFTQAGLRKLSADGKNTDLIEAVESTSENDQTIWKQTDANENTTVLSESKAKSALAEYRSKRVQADLIPFSKYTPKESYDVYEGDMGDAFGAGYSSWQEGYLDYLSEVDSEYGSNSYALIYVDNDDIPELVVDTGVEAGGCQILSYYDGLVTVLQTNRLYFEYVEKEGILVNSEGHMGYYYDYIYLLKNGIWKQTFNGNYYEFADDTDPQYDETTGRYITLHYEIDGVETDEKTYLEKFSQAYGKGHMQTPEDYLTYDEIISYLKTGKGLSAGHRYELFVEDCTWEEADRKCKEKGGYLVSMTSEEEFETVDNLIREQGLQKTCFYIGATRVGTFGWHWVEPGLAQNELSYNGPWKHWLEGQPSYRETLDDGTEVQEEYVEYIYRKSDDKFYMNDIPNDVIGLYPGYKGRMGYICEYSE